MMVERTSICRDLEQRDGKQEEVVGREAFVPVYVFISVINH